MRYRHLSRHLMPRKDVRHGIGPGLLGVLGIGLIGLSTAYNRIPWLIWNASPSAPVGLYRMVSGAPQKGDFVLVRPPKPVSALASSRHYIPANVPLVKRIAAIAGDHVCVARRVILINGHAVARQLERDSFGRKMRLWQGCRLLQDGEYFLLMAEVPASFDSRYFGPVRSKNLIGRLVPLWVN
ncbi:signal peptidase I/conjugative transfer signal peptidase TraF,TIGR02771 [Thalassospira xiamenensis M-5 = DSM 17429]|uniref:Signal peptidase I n=2 Tax=Thalassospiraceae TaxID=2844866 RepID=A0AB72UFL7_9PROT|nr:conjugative transfer signal peptidase TraF [Thalassospira xiamenensis]AJD52977.1 type IV secretory pathway, protease TraF [Thalassospira xiamenensis M-5 = DSM 17429]OHY99002.1 conjugative transfer signal peptidase TraF [Thalassospira sp. MIT1004]SIT19805.1 signal peptidase I/conjugative transfer signal peptidase TraF,TIGR02771 [Thalassospira xiamenensis M-5 = DSM 17429]